MSIETKISWRGEKLSVGGTDVFLFHEQRYFLGTYMKIF